MKVSVSIPDHLWDEARRVRPELNPSHLVQAALLALLDETERENREAEGILATFASECNR